MAFRRTVAQDCACEVQELDPPEMAHCSPLAVRARRGPFILLGRGPGPVSNREDAAAHRRWYAIAWAARPPA